MIFDFVPGKGAFLDIKVELIGGQLGEYFGSSVLALDLTRDGKSELLVGAPQHSLHPELHDRSGDEGKVYLYVNSKDGLVRAEALYGSKVKGARFGTSMASIGDINLDGFNGKFQNISRLKRSEYSLLLMSDQMWRSERLTKMREGPCMCTSADEQGSSDTRSILTGRRLPHPTL